MKPENKIKKLEEEVSLLTHQRDAAQTQLAEVLDKAAQDAKKIADQTADIKALYQRLETAGEQCDQMMTKAMKLEEENAGLRQKVSDFVMEMIALRSARKESRRTVKLLVEVTRTS
jgi:chromosome segregation ATPase